MRTLNRFTFAILPLLLLFALAPPTRAADSSYVWNFGGITLGPSGLVTVKNAGGRTGTIALTSDGTGWLFNPALPASVPGGSGSVTSVDLSTGIAGLSFTGGPITGAGTISLALTDAAAARAALGLAVGTDVLAPNGDGSQLTNLSPAALSGAVPVAKGGLGVTSGITGVLKGTGSAYAAAVAGTDYLAPSGDGSNLTGVAKIAGNNAFSGTGTTSFAGSVNVAGALAGGVNITVATSTALGEKAVYNVDASAPASGSIVLTLPDAATCPGRVYIVTKVDATPHRFNVTAYGTQTINGLSTRAVRDPNETVVLTSDGANWSATLRSEPLYGGFNLVDGLANFRALLGWTGKNLATGIGNGGLDVVSYGDSIAEGGKAGSYMFGNWAHRLKLMLQAHYNPPGVVGGYGLVRGIAGASSAMWAGVGVPADYGQLTAAGFGSMFHLTAKNGTPANDYPGAYAGSATIALQPADLNDGNGSRKALFAFDGTDAAAEYKRLKADRIQIICDVKPVNNIMQPTWDVVTDQAATWNAFTPGTGAQTYTIANAGLSESGTTATCVTSTPHPWQVGDKVVVAGVDPSGYNGTVTVTAVADNTHFSYTAAAGLGASSVHGTSAPILPTQIQYGMRVDAGAGLTPTARNLVQLAAYPWSGFGRFAQIAGVVGYYGDYDCGIRLHNCGLYGSKVDITASPSTFPGVLEAIDAWGSGNGSADANGIIRHGAVDAGLFMANWITNDSMVDPATGLTSFRANYTAFVERALACNTHPSVLLWIPPKAPGITTAWWNQYKRAMYEVAETHDGVALLDIDKLVGGPGQYAVGGKVYQLNWQWAADNIHYSDTAQAGFAQLFYQVLAGQ